MKLKSIDHINIVTGDLNASAAFYKDLLGLDIRTPPPPLSPELALWLYDEEDRAVVHLNHDDLPKIVPRDLSAEKTGSLHHVAFECSGYSALCKKLESQNTVFSTNQIPSIGLNQVFLEDPNGILLELNFRDA